MGEVNVDVAGRTYLVGGEDGEEQHLTMLARQIDAEARQLSNRMGQMSEGRLMLLTALMLADRLVETERGGAGANGQARATAEGTEDMFASQREAELAAEIDRMAERVEALAATLRSVNSAA